MPANGEAATPANGEAATPANGEAAAPGTPASPALLVVAHGTASPIGSATTRRLVEAVAAQRPDVRVELCFLDVTGPRLAEALQLTDQPVVVVPLLLSTGYHVTTDIPAAVAGKPAVTVARHLGPHPLLADAMADRLAETGIAGRGGTTLMIAAGSSQAAAAAEIAEAGELLARRLNAPVAVCTMADDVEAAIRSATSPLRVAPYLLAEGTFTDRIARAADPDTAIAAPLGTHPAVVSLVWARYDASV